jgi:hypothetical protein
MAASRQWVFETAHCASTHAGVSLAEESDAGREASLASRLSQIRHRTLEKHRKIAENMEIVETPRAFPKVT